VTRRAPEPPHPTHEPLLRELARYRLAVEHLHEGVVVYDADGAAVVVNARAQEILGVTAAELTGRTLDGGPWDVRSDDGRPLPSDRLPAWLALADGRPQLGRLLDVRVGDGRRWLLVNATPVTGADEAVLGVVVSFVDVTRVREAETALAESEAHFRLLAEHASDVVGLADLDCRYQYLSPAARRIFGRDPEALIGRSAFEFIHPEDRPVVEGVRARLVEGGADETFEYRIRHGDGGFRWVEAGVGVVRRAGGDAAAIQIHVRDVSARRQQREALRQAGELFSSAFDRAPSGMALEAPDGRVLRSNDALRAMLAAPGPLEGRPLPLGGDDAEIPLREALLAGVRDDFELDRLVRGPGGEPRVLHRTVTALRDADGAVLHCVAHHEDVTERRVVEERVRRLAEPRPPLARDRRELPLEDALALLEASAEIGQALAEQRDLETVLALVAGHALDVLRASGIVLALLEGDDVRIAAAAGDAPVALGMVVPVAASGCEDVVRSRTPQRRRDADDDSELLTVPLLAAGRVVGVLAALSPARASFDAGAERALRTFGDGAAAAVELASRVEAARLRVLLAAQEAERTRLARELHDETLQHLAAVAMRLDGLAAVAAAPLGEQVEAVADTVRGQVDGLRRVIADLRPAALADLGFAGALEALAEHAESTWPMQVALELPAAGDDPPAEVAAAAYRIVQEALTNAGRHGRPDHVTVAVRSEHGALVVLVQDDGAGFGPGEPGQHGLGLRGMRERAALVGGAVDVRDAAPGVTVHARLPLH
jgi:PAS domain S-box-containing protein